MVEHPLLPGQLLPGEKQAQPASREGSHHAAEFKAVSALLSGGFPWLRFPAPLEALFTEHLRLRVRQQAHFCAVSITLFHLLLGLAAWHFLSPEQFLLWMPPWALLGAGLLAIAALTRRQRAERFYETGAVPTAFVSLTGASLLMFLVPEPALRQYAAYGVIYLTLVVYGVAGLSLRAALAAGWLAVLAVMLLGGWLGLGIDNLLLSQSLVAANLLGAAIGYLLEHRERTAFLTARLLALETEELERVTERLGRQSQEDPLTALANRRHFNEVFQQEWDRGRRSGQPLSLVFIDVDHFKKYNDHYGHIEGDQCLIAVARVMAAEVRRAGDLAVRYGGEEFVLLLPNTPLDGALQVATQVLAGVDAAALPHAASATAPHVTVSVGVASTRPHADISGLQLLECADAALYDAKEKGRHRIESRVLEVPRLRLADVLP